MHLDTGHPCVVILIRLLDKLVLENMAQCVLILALILFVYFGVDLHEQ
jgi:hypothetical protein